MREAKRGGSKMRALFLSLSSPSPLPPPTKISSPLTPKGNRSLHPNGETAQIFFHFEYSLRMNKKKLFR